MKGLRTWIEIDSRALENNVKTFLKLIPQKTRLMAVIKSNAYGHGLALVAKLLADLKPSAYNLVPRLWFGVDSIVEGLRLRKEKITNPILVLGSTLPLRNKDAAKGNITISASNFESLLALSRVKKKPVFHLKFDTGMHRQGFQKEEMSKLIVFLKKWKLHPEGAYSHLAFPEDGKSSQKQEVVFERCLKSFKRAGINLKWIHFSGTGGVCEGRPLYNMVRVGFGLYGYFRRPFRNKFLRPVMTWKTVVTEVKQVKKGESIGYDFTERFKRNSTIAILPIGYWHGFDRGLSSIGEVLIRGRRARVTGRVSMDMTAVDVTDINGVSIWDEAVLIGRQGKEFVGADEMAKKINTTAYEILTRTNPLIKRIVPHHGAR